MIKFIDYSKKNSPKKLTEFLDKRRKGKNLNKSKVSKILKNIKKNKLKAVKFYENKYSNNRKIFPSKIEINNSIKSLDPKTKISIDFAFNRILKFHTLQNTNNVRYQDKYKNLIEYKKIPIQTVGIYVPANLPSSLMMNAIPAKIAGVKNIILANPRIDGKLNPAVIYVAKKCGIKKILNIGGAQAIGALAYILKVDKIVGPGNDFVAAAKREVFGDVGMEGMVAGPSEVTVIADNLSDIDKIATSMIAQSEHGVNSQSILIAKNIKLVKAVKEKIKKIISSLPRKKIIEKSLRTNGLIILAKNNSKAIEAINIISPEHLEILTNQPNKLKNKILNAGSVGIGRYSPVAASDYNVGTNHTLGTLGSSKFASGLNLNDFYKRISFFKLSKKGIEVIGKQAITLAKYENLHAHALSIKSRLK